MTISRNILTAILFVIITFSITFSLSANENAAVWERLYNRIDTIEYKYEIMSSIADQNSRELAPVILASLTETNAQRSSIADDNEKRIYDQLQILTLRQAGQLKIKEAEDQLYRTVKDTDNVMVRADAILALGRTGSVKYIKELVLMLRNLNLNLAGARNMRENEITAYALIMAFEYLKEIETFEPVFYAYNGWYSPKSGVRERAKNALKLITDDPTDILSEILRKETDLKNKYLALEAQHESAAPDEKKSALAVKGLFEGITRLANNVNDQNLLSEIRIISCRIISNSQVKDPDAIPYLEEMLYSRYDINEKLTAIETLGTYKSDDAVYTLSRFLSQQNDWRTEGMTQLIERRAVMGAINALVNTGSRSALEVLREVTATDWDATVRRAAREALERIEGN